MDESIAIAPSCASCQQDPSNETIVANQNVESVETLLTVTKESYQYGGTSVEDLTA